VQITLIRFNKSALSSDEAAAGLVDTGLDISGTEVGHAESR
jgi:hypothetical protein